jgi:hypothetical protein
MAGVKHVFQSTIADGADATLVRPSNWNADHEITGTITPTANDIAALGSTSLSFSDLFLASGGVINFANGDVTVTHATTTLTQTGAYKAGSLYDNTYRVGRVLLTSGSASAAATLDIVLTSYTGFRGLVIQLRDFTPATDNTTLYMRVSTDGGSSYDASGYSYGGTITHNGGTTIILAAGSTTEMQIASGMSSDSGIPTQLDVHILGQTSAKNTGVWWTGVAGRAGGNSQCVFGSGRRHTSQDTDAVRFLMSSGNLTTDYAVYGLI